MGENADRNKQMTHVTDSFENISSWRGTDWCLSQIKDSRIYGRRRANNEIFVLLLTDTGHFVILGLGAIMITVVLPQTTYRPHSRGITVSFVPITADTAVIPSSALPCTSLSGSERMDLN